MLKRIKGMATAVAVAAMVSAIPAWACTPPDPNLPCETVVQEQESNDFQQGQDIQNLGTLQPGECMTLQGDTHTGFGDPNNPNPNMDPDFSYMQYSGSTTFTVTLDALEPATNVAIFAWDAQSGQELQIQCAEMTCEILLESDSVVFLVATQDAAQYSLTFRAGGSHGGDGLPPFGVAAIEDRPMLHAPISGALSDLVHKVK
jgi:hypothetical protein